METVIGYYTDINDGVQYYAADGSSEPRALMDGDPIFEGENIVDVDGNDAPDGTFVTNLSIDDGDDWGDDDDWGDEDDWGDTDGGEDDGYSSSSSFILNGDQTSIVSEEGLMSGITVDDDGVPDTTNSLTASGKFDLSDSATSIKLEIPTEEFTSQGKQVEWSLSEDRRNV